jgi:hypothetical protein
MLSRISINLDFANGNEPVIEILHKDSDDVRDALVKSFFERLGGSSSWCKITFASMENPSATWSKDGIERYSNFKTRAVISAINPAEFKEQSEIMAEQSRLNEEYANRIAG